MFIEKHFLKIIVFSSRAKSTDSLNDRLNRKQSNDLLNNFFLFFSIHLFYITDDDERNNSLSDFSIFFLFDEYSLKSTSNEMIYWKIFFVLFFDSKFFILNNNLFFFSIKLKKFWKNLFFENLFFFFVIFRFVQTFVHLCLNYWNYHSSIIFSKIKNRFSNFFFSNTSFHDDFSNILSSQQNRK